MRLERFLEGLFVDRSAFAVPLPIRSVLRSPVPVVHRNRGNIPGALLGHLSQNRVVEVKTVLDGVTAALDCAAQTDAAVGVARHPFAPAVHFIRDGLDFLQRQRWLRDQFPIFANP